MLRFDLALEDNGYSWWYLDATSDDGLHHLVIILMIGNVFSPYYRWSRGRGEAAPLNHCAVNAILYSPRGKHWAMTERSSNALYRDASHLTIGPTSARIEKQSLVIDLAEITVPFPRRLRGQIRVQWPFITDYRARLDGAGQHWWQPLSPRCTVEVDMSHPDIHWRGTGYLDHNTGSDALENAFADWNWSRHQSNNGNTVIHYHRRLLTGQNRSLTLHCDGSGAVVEHSPAPETPLAKTTIWRMPRAIALEPGSTIYRLSTLEDTPFYARSLIDLKTEQGIVTTVHESVSLKRFRQPVVQAMLPFRMPRNSWSTIQK